jgi:hypothetical protein
MLRPRFEMADVIELFYDKKIKQIIPVYQQVILSTLAACRTATLGGHVLACDECGVVRYAYNSCRNRNCTKCQGVEKEMWVIQREEELLPLSYFHVVFTLPHELNGLCLYNPVAMYNLLFESAWYVLNTFGKDPKWLGAQSAATMVLHTWGQNLSLHPHVHCIVPAGGITKDGKWQNPRRGNAKFLYPVKAMNKVYKARFMRQLKQLLKDGWLKLPPGFPKSIKEKNYTRWKENLFAKEWVVYTKPPATGAGQVINYLARYTHSIAISNYRIINVTDKSVSFLYKDYRQKGKQKVMTLDGKIFLQRFCMHILPSRFRKVRHYGFLANAVKSRRLTTAKMALLQKRHIALSRAERKAFARLRLFQSIDEHRCPACHEGRLVVIETLSPNKSPPKNWRITKKNNNLVF